MRDDALLFEARWRKGKLGFWRWFLGIGASDYRQNDSVDVAYERNGRPMLLEGLDIEAAMTRLTRCDIGSGRGRRALARCCSRSASGSCSPTPRSSRWRCLRSCALRRDGQRRRLGLMRSTSRFAGGLHGAGSPAGGPQRAFVISVPLLILACIACERRLAQRPDRGADGAGLVGAAVVAAALELLVLSTGRDRAVLLWAAAGVLGAAVGPRWRLSDRVAVVAGDVRAAGAGGAARPARRARRAGAAEARGAAAVAVAASRPALAPLVALTLASAALSAALFLLVILLIEGWRHSPAEAALTVTVMPIAALVAGQWARERHGLVPAIAARCSSPAASPRSA